MAACTPSIHVFLGRPLFRLSIGTHSIINFGILSSGILLTWPYHCSLFFSMMSMIWYWWSINNYSVSKIFISPKLLRNVDPAVTILNCVRQMPGSYLGLRHRRFGSLQWISSKTSCGPQIRPLQLLFTSFFSSLFTFIPSARRHILHSLKSSLNKPQTGLNRSK